MNLLLVGQQTERLRFRKLQVSDFETWLPFHQDKRTSVHWEGLPEEPVTACQQQFESTFRRYKEGRGGMNALILKSTDKLIGLCGLLPQTVDTIQELEMGYSILPLYWGRGFATEAAKKCRIFAGKNQLANSLISIIQVDNIASQSVALKTGMELDKTTMYHDNIVHIYRVNI